MAEPQVLLEDDRGILLEFKIWSETLDHSLNSLPYSVQVPSLLLEEKIRQYGGKWVGILIRNAEKLKGDGCRKRTSALSTIAGYFSGGCFTAYLQAGENPNDLIRRLEKKGGVEYKTNTVQTPKPETKSLWKIFFEWLGW